MGDAREELNEEIRSIEDAAVLGKVEAFVQGMKAERAIVERDDDERPGCPSRKPGEARSRRG